MEETETNWHAKATTLFKILRITVKILAIVLIWTMWFNKNISKFGRKIKSNDPSLIEHFFGTPTDV